MRTKILIGLAAVGAVAAGLGFFWTFPRGPEELRLHGIVEIHEVRLSSKVGGRVSKVVVQEGESVYEGQPLVFLESKELEARKSQLAAQLNAAQAAWDRMLAGPRSEEKKAARYAAEASAARLAKLKAGYRPEEVEQARIDVAAASEETSRTQRDFDREKDLFARRATSPSSLDAVEWQHRKSASQLALAKAKLKMLEIGYRSQEIAEAEADEARFRASWELLNAGSRVEDKAEAEAKVEELKAKLREIDISLDETVVRAAEACVVEVLAVRKGDIVPPNHPIVRVLRTGDLWVKAYVPETLLDKVQLNQAVELTVDSHGGQRFPGKVGHIASGSEYTPRNVQSIDERRHQVFAIKIRVADAPPLFKSGMAVEVFLPLQ
jgi:HlyD family secretion protein